MKKTINLYGKDIEITLSDSATAAADKLENPLLVEIHLIMGCLIVKRVWFKEREHEDQQNITGMLNACFRVVRYPKSCRISTIDEETETPEDYPIVADKKSFVPDWLNIDFKNGEWVGEYGLI